MRFVRACRRIVCGLVFEVPDLFTIILTRIDRNGTGTRMMMMMMMTTWPRLCANSLPRCAGAIVTHAYLGQG
jgi:hypothetical protein